MAKGKQTCKILKEIRKQIAEDNDIELITSECTHKGDCEGTCPRCEAEVRYLERELEKRQRMGKAAVLAGVSIGTMMAAASCGPLVQPLAGMPADAFDNSRQVTEDTIIPERPLAGDVVAVEPPKLINPERVEDTIEPIMGLVAMYRSMIPFDAEQYQNLMKDLFVFPDMENLSIVGGEVVYESVGGPECETIEKFVEMVDRFYSPYYPGGEKKMLTDLAAGLADVLESRNYAGDMEISFFVDGGGSVRDVKVVKGIDKVLDDAVAEVFGTMKWEPATYDKNDGRISSPFECQCVQKIHFPIK